MRTTKRCAADNASQLRAVSLGFVPFSFSPAPRSRTRRAGFGLGAPAKGKMARNGAEPRETARSIPWTRGVSRTTVRRPHRLAFRVALVRRPPVRLPPSRQTGHAARPRGGVTEPHLLPRPSPPVFIHGPSSSASTPRSRFPEHLLAEHHHHIFPSPGCSRSDSRGRIFRNGRRVSCSRRAIHARPDCASPDGGA